MGVPSGVEVESSCDMTWIWMFPFAKHLETDRNNEVDLECCKLKAK